MNGEYILLSNLNIISSFHEEDAGGLMAEFMSESIEKTSAGIIRSIHDMARMGQPAVDYLVLALDDKDVKVRIAAIKALADIADPRAMRYLVNIVRDQDMTIRYAGAQALGNMRDEAAIEPLYELCRDDNCFVRTAAREAVVKILKNTRK